MPLLFALTVLLVTLASPTATSASCMRPPVEAPVIDPFRAPACRFCAGNRGLTYGVAAGSPVRAAAAGVVTFAGTVAGTGYVVVTHPDGRRATYGGVRRAALGRGDGVAAGSIVGWAEGVELHFGLRVGDTYIDPAPFLGRLVDRPRLVPTDGTAARPAPPPTLRCQTGAQRSLAR